MQDFVRGSPRVRAWPRKRGKGGTKAQRDNRAKFMNAQRATKYFSPAMYLWFMKQVEGSPLLPRDVMTMMLYNRLYVFDLDDGRSLWPMPAIYDVSEALDAIAKQPGQTIIRGDDFWKPVTAPGPQLATRWTILHNAAISTPAPNIDINGLGGWNELRVIIRGITAVNSGQRQLQLSTDNGSTFWNTSGDYELIRNTGTVNPESGIVFHLTNATGTRSGIISITGINSGFRPTCIRENVDGTPVEFSASLADIDAVRIRNTTGGNIATGTITVLGR